MSNNQQTISTTIYKADISQFKNNISKARDELKLVNAQFKASTAAMDDWTKDSAGLEAKLKQLSDTIELQDDILQNYEKELEEVQKTKQKNVEASEKLKREMQELEKVGKKNTTIYTYYAKQLQKAEKELEKNAKQEYNLKTQILSTETAIGKAEKQTRDFTKRLDDLEKGLLDANEAAKKANDGFTVFKGALADLASDAAQAGLQAVVDLAGQIADEFKKAIDAADQLDQAIDKFSAKTGLDVSENPAYEEAIRDIWASGKGEDMNAVAEAMARAKQTTGETDPEALKKLTENILVAEKTFEWDVQEQLRAANMLMEQFGITADEAYSLMIQGAQNGLDRNDDMLDTINEYSVHFKQLGYDAEDMFNMLKNGADTGAFSIDKLGDAMKEFGIRAKDNSKSTLEAFAALGTGDLSAEFAAGGERAQKALETVVDKLSKMDDSVKQNEIAVALFGTMYEDLGLEAVKALTTVQGEIDKTADAMEKIEDLQFDNLNAALEVLSRNITNKMYIPLGEQMMPLISEFVNEISTGFEQAGDDSEQLKDVVLNALDNLREGIEEMLPELSDNGAVIVETLLEALYELLPLLLEVGYEFVVALVKGLINSLDKLPAAAIDLVGTLIAKFVDFYFDFIEIGEDFVQNLIDGILNMGSALLEAGKNIGKHLIDGLKKALLDSPVGEWLEKLGLGDAKVNVQATTKELKGSTNGASGAGRAVTNTTNNTKSVVYSPSFTYNKPLSAMEIYRTNKNMLNSIVGVTS